MWDELVSKVDKGIYIAGNGSFSIDQQRFNFQFGGQVFYAIEKGKITEMLEDVAYQANTQEFWNSPAPPCATRSDYRFFGAFNDGKGQPIAKLGGKPRQQHHAVQRRERD